MNYWIMYDLYITCNSVYDLKTFEYDDDMSVPTRACMIPKFETLWLRFARQNMKRKSHRSWNFRTIHKFLRGLKDVCMKFGATGGSCTHEKERSIAHVGQNTGGEFRYLRKGERILWREVLEMEWHLHKHGRLLHIYFLFPLKWNSFISICLCLGTPQIWKHICICTSPRFPSYIIQMLTGKNVLQIHESSRAPLSIRDKDRRTAVAFSNFGLSRCHMVSVVMITVENCVGKNSNGWYQLNHRNFSCSFHILDLQ